MERLRDLAKNKSLKSFYVISAILFSLAVLTLFIISFVNRNDILGTKEIPIIVRIGKVGGLAVQNQTLDFGITPLESSAEKKIKIQNYYNFGVKVDFEVSGQVKDFIVFDSPIYLKKDEMKEISVSTIVFTNQSLGNYTGNFTATYKRDLRKQ
ncbi:MAG: hypothetical protein AABW63_00155 [Nanoarchaeota archaeon]